MPIYERSDIRASGANPRRWSAANQEIFLIDCDGLNRLNHTTEWIAPAIFTLAQKAALIAIVTQSFDRSSLPMIRRFLQLSSIIHQQTSTAGPAAALMIRDLGVSGSRMSPFNAQDEE
jgi:hypothetical protein